MYHQSYWTWLWLALAILVILLVVSMLAWFSRVRSREVIRNRGHEIHELKHHVKDKEELLASARQEIDELHCKLKKAEVQQHSDAGIISSLREEMCSLKKKIEELLDEISDFQNRLKCCSDRATETQGRLTNAENQLRSNAETIADLKNERTRLEVLLNCCQENLHRQQHENQNFKLQLSSTESDLSGVRQQLLDANRLNSQQTAEITRLTGDASCSNGQLTQLNLRAQQLHYDNINLNAQLMECRSGRVAAEERALGATREMAANKKDCCPLPAPAPIVTGPTIGHALGGTAPNGQGGGPGVGGTGGQGGGPGGPGGQVGGPGGQAGGPGGQVGVGGPESGEGSEDGGGGIPGIDTILGGNDKGKGKGGFFEAIAPLAGTAIGTAIGGPVGGVIGGAIGSGIAGS